MVELISVHIPKTAGIAFRQLLFEVYGREQVLDDYPPERIYNPNTKIEPKIAVIHGHFLPDKYDNFFPQAKKIVWLRHPIFRLISEYFFAKNIQDYNNIFHAQLLEKNLTILEFAKIPAMRNFLTRHLAGSRLEEFDFVGIQEFYSQDIVTLQKMMGWQKLNATVQNSNQYQQYQQLMQEILQNHYLIDQLAQLNEEDLKLYEFALKLRAKNRQQSPLIQSMLADYQRSQSFLQVTQQELAEKTQALEQAHYWLKKSTVVNKVLELTILNNSHLATKIKGFSIDVPQFPLIINTPAISLEGWVLGQTMTAKKIAIRCDDFLLSETDINLFRSDVAEAYNLVNGEHTGFKLNFNVTGIPLRTILTIDVILSDNSQIEMANIEVTALSNKN